MLNTVGMLDSNNNITPAAKITLETDVDGTPFDEPWGYFSDLGVMMYISRNSMPDIHFSVHQCARFTYNPISINAESVNMI